MSLARIFLAPVSWFYQIFLWFRNMAFDMKFKRTYHAQVPVISVGSMVKGGSGKTPVIEYLLSRYTLQGIKICVVTPGYQRTSQNMHIVSDGKKVSGSAFQCGDESFQIARKFPQAIVVVDDNFTRAIDFVQNRYQPHLIILDDAFHERSIARNFDILVLDGRKNLRKTPLWPAGKRREPLSALRRANMCFFTNVTSSSQAVLGSLKKYSAAPAIGVRYAPKQFRSLVTNEVLAVSDFKNVPCVVLSGIGSPQSFRNTLTEIGIQIAEFFVYADHHFYTEADLSNVNRHFEMRKARFIVMTEKDAVRLQALPREVNFPWEACYYLEIEAAVVSGESILNYTIKEKIDNNFTSMMNS